MASKIVAGEQSGVDFIQVGVHHLDAAKCLGWVLRGNRYGPLMGKKSTRCLQILCDTHDRLFNSKPFMVIKTKDGWTVWAEADNVQAAQVLDHVMLTLEITGEARYAMTIQRSQQVLGIARRYFNRRQRQRINDQELGPSMS